MAQPVYLDHFDSPLGNLTVASDGEALIGLWFDGQKYDQALLKSKKWKFANLEDSTTKANMSLPGAIEIEGKAVENDRAEGNSANNGTFDNNARAVFETTKRWLSTYFQGNDPGAPPPLRIYGSEFQKLICEIMLTVPFGETTTYGAIAKVAAERLGRERMSAQAVGGAVGHNPIGIIVPCHRVVGTNGSLTGYAGGIDKKIFLLNNEGQSIAHTSKGWSLR
ncbi:MAG: methylated-DNA--[protein]-cysteine S-methyltransferase [Lachnospiraceae bacterium]|nr:methylated-DNA--[protein]-cysteine S-methyltransferase [Lachnospiraceae bacterium]